MKGDIRDGVDGRMDGVRTGIRRRLHDVFDGIDDDPRVEERRRNLRRRLASARVDIEKNLEGSEMPVDDVQAVLEDIDAIIEILENDPEAADYLEAVRISRHALDHLSSPTGYLGASLTLAAILLRFRLTAQFAAVPVAVYLLYLLFRNVESLRTAFREGRQVVAVRVPEYAVPGDVERIPFGDVRHADAIDRAVEKAIRGEGEWSSRAIDLGGAKDMDEVQTTLSIHDPAADGIYYVQHESGVVSIELVGDGDEAVDIDIE